MSSTIITIIGVVILGCVIYELYHIFTDKPDSFQESEINKNK